MGNKVVGVLLENQSQLVFFLEGPMRVRPPILALLALGALPSTPLRFGQASAQEEERTTIGGYGEVHYTNATGPDTPGQVNVRRFVVFLSHAFSERIAFRSELELEDAKIEGGEEGGEVALEQLYVDYTLSPAATIRAGLVLPPIGIINEVHEPPTFNGVERPSFDRNVIPSTWRDIGVGLVGTLPGSSGLNYRVYLLNGLGAHPSGTAAAPRRIRPSAPARSTMRSRWCRRTRGTTSVPLCSGALRPM
jgi:hypothetical protein